MERLESGLFPNRGEYFIAYRLANADYIKAKTKRYYRKNRKAILKQGKIWYRKHKTHHTKWQIEWNRKNNDKFRTIQYRMNYGITWADYLALAAKQEFKCAICKEKETTKSNYSNKPRYLAVDHCHKTKKIRGLLCNNCNQALGRFNDNPAILRKAAHYLEAA